MADNIQPNELVAPYDFAIPVELRATTDLDSEPNQEFDGSSFPEDFNIKHSAIALEDSLADERKQARIEIVKAYKTAINFGESSFTVNLERFKPMTRGRMITEITHVYPYVICKNEAKSSSVRVTEKNRASVIDRAINRWNIVVPLTDK